MAFTHGAVMTIGTVPWTVANLRTISIDGISVDTIDVTTHDSGGVRAFVPGMIDGGTISVTGVHTAESDASQFLDMLDAGDIEDDVTITIPTGSAATVIYTFDHLFVTEYSAEAPFDAEGAFSATFKISGSVSVAAG